mgnify:CR=1 FL=1
MATIEIGRADDLGPALREARLADGLTQTDLAELVGASRERVNQVMVEFRQKGYLSVDSSHHIQVHQPPALARLCR